MITVRALRSDDNFLHLIALSREFFEEYASHHRDFFALGTLCDSDIAAFFSRSLASEDARTLVALEGGSVIGYITVSVRMRECFWKIKKEGHISGLMVGKKHRQRGVATQLLAEATAFFARKGVRHFTVCTSVNNKEAIKLYESNGMTPLLCHMIGAICTDRDK